MIIFILNIKENDSYVSNVCSCSLYSGLSLDSFSNPKPHQACLCHVVAVTLFWSVLHLTSNPTGSSPLTRTRPCAVEFGKWRLFFIQATILAYLLRQYFSFLSWRHHSPKSSIISAWVLKYFWYFGHLLPIKDNLNAAVCFYLCCFLTH